MRCELCGSGKNLQRHHIIPRSKGGGDNLSNLMTVCVDCHSKIHGRPTGSFTINEGEKIQDLTPKQISDLMVLRSVGYTNVEIANKMDLSVKTILFYNNQLKQSIGKRGVYRTVLEESPSFYKLVEWLHSLANPRTSRCF